MQTTHKIPGSSATRWSKYLLSQRSRADYQLRDGERAVPTRWHGSPTLLASLGLDAGDPVELEQLRPLMHGYSPVDGGPIRPAGADGTRTAGIDLTFSPPKDVSALWAVSSPYRRAQLEAAHRSAVASALRKIERDVSVVRRKTRGVVRFEKARCLLAAESVHTTSRLSRDQDSSGIPDPQLHSHVAVIAAERLDGKIAAVESRQLYLAARETGAWYRAELAHNLQRLGLGIERRAGRGERYFNISGVSQGLSERWSVRAGDVDRAAQVFRRRYGREPDPGELDGFTLKTRGPKSTASERDINEAWRSVAQEYELTRDRVEGLFDYRARSLEEGEVDLTRELLAETTSERSMITSRELNAKAYELSAGVCRPGDADRLITELERAGELIRLEQGMWTTRDLRELERETIRIALERAGDTSTLVSGWALARAREEVERQIGAQLTAEQQRALESITGPGGITVLVGQAGTGKGVVISAATRAWQLEGYEVIGTAIAGATAKRLQADTNVQRSMTTDSLLHQVENGRVRLDSRTVVVMDETGMADSDRLPRLIRLTAEHNTRVLLAGDSAQLSPVGPGGLFAELERRVPTAELTEVHRARHERERQAWAEVRDGEPGKALARYQAYDRLHIHDTREQAAQRMVKDWHQTRRELGRSVMIIDASNQERDRINALAQEHRVRGCELGADRVELPGKPYGLHPGDEIIFTAQHRVPGRERVENGTLGRILEADAGKDRVLIQTREREPRHVEVDTHEFSGLSLAYAVHVYKAQGLTTETSHVLTGGWQTDREHTYVALTRARDRTDIYLSREDLGEHGMDPGAIERLADLMARSRTEQASITRSAVERSTGPEQTHPQERDTDRDRDEPNEQARPAARDKQPDRGLEHDKDEIRREQQRVARENHAERTQGEREENQDSRGERVGRSAESEPRSEVLDHGQGRGTTGVQREQTGQQHSADRDQAQNVDHGNDSTPVASEHPGGRQERGAGAEHESRAVGERDLTIEPSTRGAESDRASDQIEREPRYRQPDPERTVGIRHETDLRVGEQTREPEQHREPRHQQHQVKQRPDAIDQVATGDRALREAIRAEHERQAAWEQAKEAGRERETGADRARTPEERHDPSRSREHEHEHEHEHEQHEHDTHTSRDYASSERVDERDSRVGELGLGGGDRTDHPGQEVHPEHDRGPRSDRDRNSERALKEAIKEQYEQQHDWERGLDPDRDIDQGHGIE